jgi:hypothetical protein
MEIFNDLNQAIPIKSVEVINDRWEVKISDMFWTNKTYKFYIEYLGQVDQENSGFISIKYNKNGSYLLSSNPNGNFASVMPHLLNASMGVIQLSVNVPSNWTAVFNSLEDINKRVNKFV